MMMMVLGGAASGKSEYAERMALEMAGEDAHYYLATMQPYGESGAFRVRRHRKLREGKGFVTMELTQDIAKAADLAEQPEYATILLEDLSNLLANEMFSLPPEQQKTEPLCSKIITDIEYVKNKFKNLILVSNNIFEDGDSYDPSTIAYRNALGKLHVLLAPLCDRVTEVVVGIPKEIK